MACSAFRMFGVAPKLLPQWKCSLFRPSTIYMSGARGLDRDVFSSADIRLYSDYTGPPPTEPVAGAFRNPRQVFTNEKNIYTSRQTGNQIIPRETDVVVIGGGLVGLSTAFWLKQQNPTGYSVTVIEQDDTYSQSSSALAVGGIRQQFSMPENIQLSIQTAEFLRNLRDYLQILDFEVPEVHFTPQGYLILSSENDAQELELDYDTQNNLGVQTDLMSADNLKSKFPWLNVSGIALSSYGLQNEGWFDTHLLLAALKAKLASFGVTFVKGEVVGFGTRTTIVRSMSDQAGHHERKILTHVHIRNGTDKSRITPVQFAFCFNCAGPFSRDIARLAGIGTGVDALAFDLPIIPRRRFIYSVHCPSGPGFNMPMLVDTSGFFIRREGLGSNYICATAPSQDVEQAIGETCEAMNDYFWSVVHPDLVHRIPCFENAKLVNSWSSFYEHNYFDRSPFVGNHPYHRNFAMATGLCGLGAQHGPAIGRALMESFIYDEYRTVDLSRFTFDRLLDDNPISERLSF